MTMRRITVALAAALAAALLVPAETAAAQGMADCEMEFSLSSWSAFYKSGKGEGTVTCSNGQSARVALRVRGGGLTVGKSEILNGKARFSEVKDISEIFGSYATAEAHAGVVKSSGAQVMTKGPVSMALAGTGRGVDLGVSFGKFQIKRR
jgi:hypothetical protein